MSINSSPAARDERERVTQGGALAPRLVHLNQRGAARDLERLTRAQGARCGEPRRLAQEAGQEAAVPLFGRRVGRADELRVTRRRVARGPGEHLRAPALVKAPPE